MVRGFFQQIHSRRSRPVFVTIMVSAL